MVADAAICQSHSDPASLGHTIGDDPAAARRAQAGPPTVTPVGFDVVSGIADVIVVWNVLEHFWPYWSVVSVD